MSYATFLNFYQTTLGAALSSTATTMTVSSTTGLPSSLASGQFIPMTLTPASNPGSAYEIVYVTGISGSSLTVTRGEEGTSALNWSTGDILYSTNTAQTTGTSMGSPSTDFQTNTLTASGLITANGGIDVAGGTLTIPNATANNQPVALAQSLAGATPHNVLSSRAFNTVYTNTTNRPMFVKVQVQLADVSSGGYQVSLDIGDPSSPTGNLGTAFSNVPGSIVYGTVVGLVYPGYEYELTQTSGISATIETWSEDY